MANGGVIDFYHPVVSYGLIEPYISLAATNTRGFFKKRLIFRKRNLSLTKIPAEEAASIAESFQQVEYLAAHIIVKASRTGLFPLVVLPVMNPILLVAGSKSYKLISVMVFPFG